MKRIYYKGKEITAEEEKKIIKRFKDKAYYIALGILIPTFVIAFYWMLAVRGLESM